MSDYFELLTASEVFALPDPTWLIEGLLPEGGYSSIYGAPGSYKSFLAIDWALHISQGVPWLGRAVKRGPAIYVAAEGGRGIKRRMRAWVDHYHASPQLPGAYFLMDPLYVQQEGVVESFIELLQMADIVPELMVIDTVSRCFIGEENASEDMAKFVDRMTALARGRAMTALVVHHTNAIGERERGHSAFRGGAEAMFKTQVVNLKSGQLSHIVVTCTKQKDEEEADPIYLKPEKVGTSIILQPTLAPAEEHRAAVQKTVAMRKQDMLSILESHPEGLTVETWLIAAKVPRATGFRRIKQLVKEGEIIKDSGRYFACPSVTDLAELGEVSDEVAKSE